MKKMKLFRKPKRGRATQLFSRSAKSERVPAIRQRKALSVLGETTPDLDRIDYRIPGDSIGVRFDSGLEAVKLVESGLLFSAIERLQRATGLTFERIKTIARITEGTFSRRKLTGRLSPDESERIMRLGRVFERATSLYEGDQNSARQWLETPMPALGNQRPLDLSQTEPGAREIEDLIGRIENGIVS